ncbi:MAG TPA: FG-GAP-like repeat-containing protein [Acidisarcina sp.]|nr:FG-GAP-like repeat-containing protein [Acidisarcina sp.]
MPFWSRLFLGVLLLPLAASLAQAPPARHHSPPSHVLTPPYPASAEHPAPAWFVDVAAQAGVQMENINGEENTKKYIIETTGSGVAIFDYDHDGWPDIFLVNGDSLDEPNKGSHPTSHLYHNNHDGTFTDVTRAAGLTASGWGQGACVGDYDNDGYDDLYVTYYGKNRLYHNEGNGTFKEVAEQAGVAGTGGEWGAGCAFVDYDRDGKLDLIVSNYVHFDVKTAPRPGQGVMCIWKGTPVMCGPRGLESTPNVLYHNLGGGRFANVSKASGIEKTEGHYCLSVSTLDYNGDGWPDIYVACDSTPSILYRNNKDGTFTDVAVEAAVAFNEDGREQAGMGSSVADYDGDGLPDIFKTNFSDDTSSLYRNNGDGTFTSTVYEAGLGLNTQYLGWGVMFLDLDNDGWPDVMIVNGHVYPEVDSAHLGSSYREPRLVYWNQGNGKFLDISQKSGPGCLVPKSSRGLAIADLWNDGRESAVVNNMGSKPLLLVNQAANKNHWLGAALVGTRSNRDGIGATVTVVAGGRRLVQEVRSGSSYLSNNDMRLHFGLGTSTHIDRVEVRWPSGLKEVFPPPAVDRMVTLTEGSGTPSIPAPSVSAPSAPTSAVPASAVPASTVP